uniref:LPS assembly lipoprotein LptE n=1 Tax=Ignavibacterium sp. TaxID=2651167 RepID=UPI00404AAAA2
MLKVNLKKFSLLFLLIALTVVLNFTACCSYSFTGASVPKHLKTIAISIADDKSGSAEIGLRESLTQKLIQKFIDDNSLQVTDRVNADAILECTVVSFNDAPAIVSAGENVTSRRITIGVKASYKDLVKKVTIFDKTFTSYQDYPQGGSLSDRNNAIEKVLDQITEDILLETVSGW